MLLHKKQVIPRRYTQNELVGQHTRILKSGKQNNQFYSNMWQALLKDQKFEGIFISKKKNGDFFYDKKVITVVKDKDLQPLYYLAICFDVTKVKNALNKSKTTQ